jgi:hypothetical protein
MDKLHAWLEAQFAGRKVEPTASLGKAIAYLLRHWKTLTLFLRQAGAPLDNNLCERALKRAVLPRKNALFDRTLNGAQVGDLFMSLIHSCELFGASSGPLPNWRWMEIDQISDAQTLDQTFPGGRPTPSGKHHIWHELFIRVKPSKKKPN